MDATEQAAILLLGMGEQQAAHVLKHMGARQVEKVIKKMTEVKNITQEQIEQSLSEFTNASRCNTSLGLDSSQYIRKTLVGALGSDKASSLIDRTLSDSEDTGIEVLKWQDAPAIASLIRDEHPQVVAVILTYLDAEKAAEVMRELSEVQRNQIMPRIATMRAISPQALHELNVVIEEGSKDIRSFKPLPTAGTRSAADMLNFMNTELEGKMLDKLHEHDKKIAEKVKNDMFSFEKLIEIDKQGLQTLLREIANDTMVLALKGAEESLQKSFFSNMSTRAADRLKDALEAKGPVQLNKVEDAQKEIVATAQRMAKEGIIVMRCSGEQMVG